MVLSDFLGPVKELAEQWKNWGREFGGKEPKGVGSVSLERAIATVGAPRGQALEMQKRESVSRRLPRKIPTALPIKQPAQSRSLVKPVSGISPSGPVTAPRSGARKVPMPGAVPRMTGKRTAPTALNQIPGAPRIANGQTVTAKHPVKSTQSAAAIKAEANAGVSRQKFLDQLKAFRIENLRPAGQSAALRIGQVNQQLATVLAGVPQDRPKVQTALRSSPLLALYQEQGQETIRSGKPLDHVIYERYQSGRPYLLKEEFEAVAKLMKSLQ